MAADGNDVIDGGTGVDTLSLAAGQAFTFNTSNARLTNVEVITLGAGSSVNVTGQTEAFTFVGGGGSETIVAGSNNDTINAGLGDDVITGAAGADVINGQGGNDTASYADVTGATSHALTNIEGMAINLTENDITDATIGADLATIAGVGTVGTGNTAPANVLAAGTAQYLVTDIANDKTDNHSIDTLTSIEGIIGSGLNDYIVLGADASTVSAGAGDDMIFSGSGVDNISGEAGDDVINIGLATDHAAGETITGGDGDDRINFTSELAQTLVLSANVTGVETVAIADTTNSGAGTTNESINASALTAGIALVGNAGLNVLTGSAFADTFAAGAGNDTIVADDADTLVDGEGGTDDVMQLAANATFTAAELDNIEQVELADGVSLTVDYTDVVDGTIVNQIDTVTGVAGGATETLIINGHSAAVTIDYSAVLTLTDVSLDFRGGAGAEDVTGTAAVDTISGGVGDDTIDGFGGADVLTGGSGNDTFQFDGECPERC